MVLWNRGPRLHWRIRPHPVQVEAHHAPSSLDPLCSSLPSWAESTDSCADSGTSDGASQQLLEEEAVGPKSASSRLASLTSSAEAERRATEGESVRRNAKSERPTYSNCLREQPVEQSEDSVAGDTTFIGEEMLTTAFGEQRGRRGGTLPFRNCGRRRCANSTRGSMRGRSYNWAEIGYCKADCPQLKIPDAPSAGERYSAEVGDEPSMPNIDSFRQSKIAEEASSASVVVEDPSMHSRIYKWKQDNIRILRSGLCAESIVHSTSLYRIIMEFH